MAEILSQNEIDALLSALTSGQAGTDSSGDKDVRGVKLYDFKHPDRFSKDQIRSLQMIHDHFARIFSTSLSTFLRTIVEVKLVSVDQLSYDEFIRSIPNPTCINIVDISPLNGSGVLEISPPLSFSIVDRLMGGRGSTFKSNRELTEIERSIVLRVVDRIFEGLSESWESVMHLEFTLNTMETNPQMFLQLHLPTEMVILLTLEATIGDHTGTLCLCLPHVVLEPVQRLLSSRSWITQSRAGGDSVHTPLLTQHLRKVFLDVRAYLGTAHMSVNELMSLTTGDVVVLDNRKEELLLVEINQEPKYFASPGVYRKHKAIKLIREVEPEDLR